MRGRGALGRSESRDSAEAGREAVRAALDELGGPADALLLFATAGHDQAALFEAVRRAAGNAPIAGCTGAGVITTSGSDEGSHAVAVLALRSSAMRFTAWSEAHLSRDAEAIGARLGARAAAGDRPRMLLLFPDGISGSSSAVLRGLERTAPEDLAVFGGTAGELLRFDRTHQYGSDGLLHDGVSAMLIEGDAWFDVALSHGCQLMDIEHRVTRAEGGTVHELDGRPAWEVMREYVVPDGDTLGTEDVAYLGVAQHEPGIPPVIRVPLRHDRATGALFFPGELRAGDVVTMARRDVDDVIGRALEAASELGRRAAGREACFVLQADCVGRGHLMLGDAVGERLARPVQAAFGASAPWIGFHSYGEIAPTAGRVRYHNYTMALCAAYDTPPPSDGPPR